MTIKVLSRAARLLGFVVSPLLTAPAAAADVERGILAAASLHDRPAAWYRADLPGRASDAACRRARARR